MPRFRVRGSRHPGDARPYRLSEVREKADELARTSAWHLFISYARNPDSTVALQIRRHVMRVARPWWGFSNLRVFLDKEAMMPASGLPQQIAEILRASSAMALLAGPASAASPWVGAEVGQWLRERGERPLVILHTGGELGYLPPDSNDGDIDWAASNALDHTLFDHNLKTGQRTIFLEDLFPIAQARKSDLGGAPPANTARAGLSRLGQAAREIGAGVLLRRAERAAFRRTALAIVACVLDLDRDRLSSYERRRRRWSFCAVAAVVVVLAGLVTTTLVEQAREQQAESTSLSRKLAAAALANAPSEPDVAALLAAQAYKTWPTPEAAGAVVAAASGPLARVLRGHTATVTSVAVAGFLAVTGSDDGTARVWDTRTGATTRVIKPGCGAIRQVAISSDAGVLLTVCPTVTRSWDPVSGTLLHGLTSPNMTFRQVAYTPGNDLAVVEGEEGVAWLWHARGGGLVHTLPGHTRRVTTAAFTPDGRTLATGDEGGTTRLWNTATGALVVTLATGRREVTDLAFSGDGATLAAADNDGTASLWDAAGHARLHLLNATASSVSSLAIAPDNRTVAAASIDGSLRTWDLATGALRHTMTSKHAFPATVRYSHDGRYLLTVSIDHTASLWDAERATLSATLVGHTDAVRAGEFCADDSCVLTVSVDGTGRLWTTADIAARKTYNDPARGGLRDLTYGVHGTVLAAIYNPGSAFLIDARSLTTLRSLDIGPGGDTIDVSPDGQTVATGGNGVVRLWDLATGRPLATMPEHTATINSVRFSPDGALVASAAFDKTVRLWDAHTGALLHVLHGAWTNPWVMAFSPHGDMIATSYRDEHVQIWDTRSGALLHEVASPFPITNQSNAVTSLAFSPDGSLLATSGQDHVVCLWDPRAGTLVRALRGADDGIGLIGFSPDGSQLAAAGHEHLARIWEVRTGKPLFVLGGYADELSDFDYSGDGRQIAVGSDDGTLRFWDTTTGQLLKTLRLARGFARVRFSPDSTSLAVVGFDSKIRLWDPPPTPDDAAAIVCRAIGRTLTDAEWAPYAAGSARPDACAPPG